MTRIEGHSTGNQTAADSSGDIGLPDVPFGEAVRVWAKIGFLSFGGPAGQIALMHRILVDEKRWISESRFLHALNFCMILPGPEAQQLATYTGWLLHRIRGGLVAGTLFVLPGFFVIFGLSFLYVTAGTLPFVQGLFLGLKAAVIAIVLQAVIRIARRSLHNVLLMSLAIIAFLGMYVFGISFPIIIVIAAAIGYLASRREKTAAAQADNQLPRGTNVWRQNIGASSVLAALWILPILAIALLLGPGNVFSKIGFFFSKMAVVTFGGAYAVLAYVAQEAVQAYQWLVPSEMIDGLAMAETTPGPLIMVVQFVGFMAAYRNPGTLAPGTAGFLGSLLTTWVTFMPCFLWIFLGAPHIERLRQNKALSGAFSAVTAAVVGVIANLAAWFASHSLFADVSTRTIGFVSVELPDPASFRASSILITVVAVVSIFRLNASVPATLLVSGILGMAATAISG